MPSIKSNSKHMQSLMATAPAKNREKIINVIDFHESRLENYKAALNAVVKLWSPSGSKKGDADTTYEKIVAKYQMAEPRTGRIGRRREGWRREAKRKAWNPREI